MGRYVITREGMLKAWEAYYSSLNPAEAVRANGEQLASSTDKLRRLCASQQVSYARGSYNKWELRRLYGEVVGVQGQLKSRIAQGRLPQIPAGFDRDGTLKVAGGAEGRRKNRGATPLKPRPGAPQQLQLF